MAPNVVTMLLGSIVIDAVNGPVPEQVWLNDVPRGDPSPQSTLTATPVPVMGKVTDPGVLPNVKANGTLKKVYDGVLPDVLYPGIVG